MQIRFMTLDEFLTKAPLPAKHYAAAVGISAAQLSRIRHGHSRPSWETAKRISRLTDYSVTASSLMDGEEEMVGVRAHDR
jgi:transcriptional regulator with XRE-family HTH domain